MASFCVPGSSATTCLANCLGVAITTARDANTQAERKAELEAVMVEGRAAIVYSKNDTLAMLKGVHDPYANAYDAESARKIALNVLCYAVKR